MNAGEQRSYWEGQKESISQYITKLWETPELPMMEYRSAQILTDWLEEEGFEVEREYCGLPTAFKAVWGSGSPVIGVLAEYDGLAGLSNEAVPERREMGREAGHACLHCHIGGGNTGAAIAAGHFLRETHKSGTVIVIGCPAEEILYGKVALLGRGGFDGIDVLLTSHVDYQNAAVSRPTLSCFSGEFCFGGISSHTGAARAHNALDGAELAVETLERMRGHQFPRTSVEHVIRSGGAMPNITPDRASLWINVRDADYSTAKQVYEYVREIVKEAAKIAGVGVAEGFLSGTHGYLPNHTLGQLLLGNMREIGKASYTDEELDWIGKLCKNAVGSEAVTSSPEIVYLEEGVDPYSQDDGEASWHIPLGRVNWEIPPQVPLHNWCTTALAGTEFSKKGAMMASEALYLSIVEILLDPSIAEAAKEELKQRLEGISVPEPIYQSFDTLTKDPKSFWNGTWLNDRI